MKLDYFYADPTGNVTLLVETPVPAADYPAVAARLLALEPAAEQVGFIERPALGGDIRLHMAGGEFCGNASLSTAAVSLFRTGKTAGTVTTEVYGLSAPLKAELTLTGPDTYAGSIGMPQPTALGEVQLTHNGKTYNLPLVSLSGISHLICTGEPFDDAPAAIRAWSRELGADALGIMFLNEAHTALTPLVYVRSGDTLYWEHSCASGTCSTAAWFSRNAETPRRFTFAEPGGELSAEACRHSLRLLGCVTLEQRSAEL